MSTAVPKHGCPVSDVENGWTEWQVCLYLTKCPLIEKSKAISLTEDNTGTGSYLTR